MSDKVVLRFSFNARRDVDILAWLEQQPNRSLVVRKALRAWMSREQGLDEEVLRRVLREELAQVTVQGVASIVPVVGQEDEEVTEALDALLGTWSDLDSDET
jgi:phosphoserine phosphatase